MPESLRRRTFVKTPPASASSYCREEAVACLKTAIEALYLAEGWATFAADPTLAASIAKMRERALRG